MLIEIVCELADMELCRTNKKTLDEMCNAYGVFLEEYQDQFNQIYDRLERSILDYMNE